MGKGPRGLVNKTRGPSARPLHPDPDPVTQSGQACTCACWSVGLDPSFVCDQVSHRIVRTEDKRKGRTKTVPTHAVDELDVTIPYLCSSPTLSTIHLIYFVSIRGPDQGHHHHINFAPLPSRREWPRSLSSARRLCSNHHPASIPKGAAVLIGGFGPLLDAFTTSLSTPPTYPCGSELTSRYPSAM